jgi:hypothetical protein
MDSILILNNLNVTKIENNINLDKITACNQEFLEKFQIKRILKILEDEIPYPKGVQNIYYKHISYYNISVKLFFIQLKRITTDLCFRRIQNIQ